MKVAHTTFGGFHLIGLGGVVAAFVLFVGCSGGSSPNGGEGADAGGGDSSTATAKAESAAMVEPLRAYMAIGDRLAADSIEGLDPHVKALKRAKGASIPAGAIEQLKSAGDVAAARAAYGEISEAMMSWVDGASVPDALNGEVAKVHCPMVKEDVGDGWWLQAGGEVRNPFKGSQMLRCHDKHTVLSDGDASPDAGNEAEHEGHGEAAG